MVLLTLNHNCDNVGKIQIPRPCRFTVFKLNPLDMTMLHGRGPIRMGSVQNIWPTELSSTVVLTVAPLGLFLSYISFDLEHEVAISAVKKLNIQSLRIAFFSALCALRSFNYRYHWLTLSPTLPKNITPKSHSSNFHSYPLRLIRPVQENVLRVSSCSGWALYNLRFPCPVFSHFFAWT